MPMPGCISTIDTRGTNMAGKRTHKKLSAGKKILLFVAEILLLALLVGIVLIYKTLNQIDFEPKISPTEAGINEDISPDTLEMMDGYTNIALFGLDNRKGDKYDSGNSDSIMVASINNTTKEVRLVSVYRDTYLKVDGYREDEESIYNKANSAYARGGVENAIRMLNTNLDLDITSYVCVDWNALVEAIDALGGVEIEITEEEVDLINFYVEETAAGANADAKKVTESGTVTLDGVQATSYARIRYTKGMDFERASRQRIVLQAMLDKARKADFTTLTKICNAVFDDIQTSLTLKDILFLAKDLTSYDLVSTSGFPFDVTNVNLNGKDMVVPIDLYANVEELHKFLFEEEYYSPSSTVQAISDRVMRDTGVTEGTAAFDTSKYNETIGASGTGSLGEESTQQDTQEVQE